MFQFRCIIQDALQSLIFSAKPPVAIYLHDKYVHWWFNEDEATEINMGNFCIGISALNILGDAFLSTPGVDACVLSVINGHVCR